MYVYNYYVCIYICIYTYDYVRMLYLYTVVTTV